MANPGLSRAEALRTKRAVEAALKAGYRRNASGARDGRR